MRVEIQKRSLKRSEELWKKAIKLTPAGTQCYSHGPTQYVSGVSPKFLVRGSGCFVWDADGNKYLDFSSGGFPIILGYGYKPVADAVYRQLKNGTLFPMMNPLEVEVAEMLTKLIPCAEMVRFGKNGGDVTSMAVRAAKTYTGRDLVVSQGYHGKDDWYICTTERNGGVLKGARKSIETFKYNDLESFKKILDEKGDKVACVIMEPVQLTPPKENFLSSIKKIAHKHGALLVFDEVITGFRFDMGGAQNLFNVTPDLGCFGKSMANGLPVAALVGKTDIMESFGFNNKAFFSTTFGGEAASLMAAKATMQELQDRKVIPFIWKQGKRMKDGFNKLVKDHGLESHLACEGYPVWNDPDFVADKLGNSLEKKSLFQQEAMKRGLLAELCHAMSFAHTNQYVDMGLEIYNTSMQEFKRNLDKVKNGTNIRKLVEGNVIKPVFKRLD
jgi:glutamate-1-semialdehyde 2,1-aminomutase/spore coat polysaccharide biosynthesis protein SpsF